VAERQGLLARGATRVFSDGTLTKRASLNAFASGVELVTRTIVSLFLTPLLLSRLGDSVFGVWQVLQRLVVQASPASGRPGEALKWVVANRQSSTDYEEKRRQVGNAVAVWFLFFPVQLAAGAVVGWFAPVWLHVPGANQGVVRLAAALLVVNLLLGSLEDLPRAVLQGENLGYRRIGLAAAVVLVGGALTAGALFLGTGLVGVAAATVAAGLLSGTAYFFIAKRYVVWFGIARPHLRGLGRFAGLSGWFLLWNLVMKAMNGADLVVLGIAGSARLVTTYTLSRFVPFALAAVVAVVILAIMPGLGGLIGAGDLERARSVRTEMMAATWLMGTVAGSLILIWEASFLRLWVGEQYYPGMPTMILIVAMVMQWALIRIDTNIIDLTLNLRWKVLVGVLSTVLCLGLSWVLVDQGSGIMGTVIGFTGGRAILSFVYPWMIGRRLGIPPMQQLLGLVRPTLATVGVFAVSAFIGSTARTGSWSGLVFAVAISALLAGPIVFFAGLNTIQRQRMWKRARRVARLT
jgi:O-antigen/teichoic acid export membrane protein